MTILILNGYCGDNTFHFAGASSKEYLFKWDKVLTAYRFNPTCQEDADDIFKQAGTMWNITALCEAAAPSPAVTVKGPKPALPARYYADLDADELVEMARNSGFEAKETDGKTLLMRLLGAYFLGAGLMRENPVRAAELVKGQAIPQAQPPAPVSITAEDIPIAVAPNAPLSVSATLNGTPVSVTVTNETRGEISDATGKPKRKYVKNPRGPLVPVSV